MTTDDAANYWLNYEEGMELVRGMTDKLQEQFVMRGVTAAILQCSRGEPPAAPYDMLFFVETMIKLYEQKSVLVRILSGEDLGWWSDHE